MKLTLSALAVLCAIILPLSASAKNKKNGSAFGVTVVSCVVNSNGGNTTNGINVVYYNTHPLPAVEVDFLVRYHHDRAVLTDRGTFAQGAQINHNLTNGMVGFGWQGPDPYVCTVKRVVLQNGKVFQ